MVYNVTIADASGVFATVYLSPDRKPVVTNSPLATNHQKEVEWPDYAKLTATVERKDLLLKLQAGAAETEESITQEFLTPPLLTYNYDNNFGTLYTINYNISEKSIQLHWPQNKTAKKSFEVFEEEILSVQLPPVINTGLVY